MNVEPNFTQIGIPEAYPGWACKALEWPANMRVELRSDGPPSSDPHNARKGSAAAVGHKVRCFVVAACRTDDDGGKTS